MAQAPRLPQSPARRLAPGRPTLLAGMADGAEGLVIADLAQQTRDEHLKLTLLDSGSTRWPPGPSARLLTLLESDLPWTISLTDRAGHSAQPAPAATRP